MKKLIKLFLILVSVLLLALPVDAAKGSVTYSGNSGEFIFAQGSDYSPTDLFSEFKDVMPGDTLTQKITVKNNANNKVKVKIYMRSLGAQEISEEFLSKLQLSVIKSNENEMAYMFDAAASETAQLTDWVLLGTLYSGGEVNLDVILNVPVELDNAYQKNIGYLDWEFKIEEFPIEEGDPTPPATSDEMKIGLVIGALVVSVCLIIILIKKRKDKK